MPHVFLNLDEEQLAQELHALLPELEYLTLCERQGQNNEETLWRQDLVTDEGAPDPGDASDGDEDGGNDLIWDLIDQVKRAAAANVVDEPSRRFRLHAYGIKGHKRLRQWTFLCRDEGWEEPEETTPSAPAPNPIVLPSVTQLPAPAPVDHQLATELSKQTQQILGTSVDHWQRFMAILLGGVGDLSNIMRATVQDLRDELGRSSARIDKVLGAHLDLQRQFNEVKNKRTDAEVQAELIEVGLGQIADLVRAWMAGKSLSEEDLVALRAVSSNPALLEALKDQAVLDLLKDPDAAAQLRAFAQMRRQAAPPPSDNDGAKDAAA